MWSSVEVNQHLSLPALAEVGLSRSPPLEGFDESVLSRCLYVRDVSRVRICRVFGAGTP